MKLAGPHATRSVRFLGLWRPRPGWRVKTYGIRHAGERPDAPLVDMAQRATAPVLPPVDAERGPYGVGFLGVHQGRGADFAFLDWWSAENELHHHVWSRSGAAPLAKLDASGPSACVWDLAVQWRERGSWVRQVLANPAGPDVDAYANDVADWEA